MGYIEYTIDIHYDIIQLHACCIGRTDGPCLVESIGGNILTIISQHELSLPKSALAIGDFNSNVRIFQIPDTLATPKENETQVNSTIERFFEVPLKTLSYCFLVLLTGNRKRLRDVMLLLLHKLLQVANALKPINGRRIAKSTTTFV